MRLQKGICIELDGDHSVYMLADGRFVTGRPQEGTTVGKEAYFESEPAVKVNNRRLKPLAMPFIAAVAVLFLAISTWMLPAQEAYGYVQIESNPGIELGVDDKWQVISLRELNEDGKQLIEQLADWKNQSLEDVLKKVLALSVDDETEHVTITTVQEEGDTKTVTTVEQIALAALFAGSNKKLHVHMKEANKKQWREAKKQMVPVAQFVEKDRTFTSSGEQKSDVQPARYEDNRINKAKQNKGDDRKGPTQAENSDAPAVEPNKNQISPSKGNDAEKSPASPGKLKPDATKATGSKELKVAPKAPAAKKEPAKPENPSTDKVKNPNAGKGNNSAPVKSKENPAENRADPSQKNEKEKKAKNNQNKEKSNENKASKEKSKSEGTGKKNPPSDKDTQKKNPSSSKSEKGNGAEDNRNSVQGRVNEKGHTPNAGKKTEKSNE